MAKLALISALALNASFAADAPKRTYVEQLRAQYGTRIIYKSDYARQAVEQFEIGCPLAKDGRYVPLENMLLANLSSSRVKTAWLTYIADSRGKTVRIISVVQSKGGPITEPHVDFVINEWSELIPNGISTEALLNTCSGSYGEIWKFRPKVAKSAG